MTFMKHIVKVLVPLSLISEVKIPAARFVIFVDHETWYFFD